MKLGIFNFGGGKPKGGKPEPDRAPDRTAPAQELPEQSLHEMEEKVVEALRTVYDPEIPVNIYELGLVYNISVRPTGDVLVRMTLTSPMCPVAGSLPPEVEYKVLSIPGVTSARVELVWDPPWNPEMMTEAARLQLGML